MATPHSRTQAISIARKPNYRGIPSEFMESYSNGPDCVKRKLEVISKKTDPTEGIPHMFGNGGLNTIKETNNKSTVFNP